MKEIYSDASRYFKRNRLGPLIYSKYDPSRIHKKIDDIIDKIKFPRIKDNSSKHATLLDLRNLLNPENSIDDVQAQFKVFKHGNLLEFVNDIDPLTSSDTQNAKDSLHRVKHERVLLITAYNVTRNAPMIFNTSDARHWGYRIADVLKSTMAEPTYFPPHEVYQGVKTDGLFLPGKILELYIDVGVFVEDPVLEVARMHWKKQISFDLISIGTGHYNATLPPSISVRYKDWIFKKVLLLNTLIDATRNNIEKTARNLTNIGLMKRMKLNYKITKEMDLDDPAFVRIFDEEWEDLQNGVDCKAFLYFYDKYIQHDV